MSEDALVEGTPLIAPSNTDHPLYDNIVDGIRTVYDPEIPVNIFDLGLIYTVEINDVRWQAKCRAGLPRRLSLYPA